MTSRRYCFTGWNATVPPAFDEKTMNFLCYQMEIAPTTKKLHWQGYVEWKTPRRAGVNMAKLLAGETGWFVLKKNSAKREIRYSAYEFLIARGDAAANKKYCSKTESAVAGSFKEFGKPSTQGARTDIAKACELLKTEGNITATWRKMPVDTVVRYGRSLENYARLTGLKEPERKRVKPTCLIFWSEASGIGKSKLVNDVIEKTGVNVYRAQCNRDDRTWWAGYTGQRIVFFDEYEPGMLTDNFLLQMLSYDPCRVKTYGNEVPLMANKFVFTSNFDPKTWVNDKRKVAWLRRLNEFCTVTFFEKKISYD